MRPSRTIALLLIILSLLIMVIYPETQAKNPPGLTLSTPYPAQVVQPDETVTLSLTVHSSELPPQIVRLEVREAPEGWKTSFLGGGNVVRAVYVPPEDSATISLRLEPPKEIASGTYRFLITAKGQQPRAQAELPIELIVEEKLPPKLQLDVELPILRGAPSTTFRYRATLRNESDQELLVNLEADAPEGFTVRFKLAFGAQEVTSFPLKAGESKSLDVELMPPHQIAAGDYRVNVRAQSGEAQATLGLTAVVTGQPELSVTTPDGRVSGQATAGRETPLKIVVRNQGSAPARDVELSASEPFGWSVEFEPSRIAEIRPNEQAEVIAKIKPSEKAVAGDYMLSITARTEGVSESEQFRITVSTSTLWGIVGVVLIAIALGAVGLAVSRFGRR